MTIAKLDLHAEAITGWEQTWVRDGKIPAGDEEPAMSALIDALALCESTFKTARNAASSANDMCVVRVEEERIYSWLRAAFGEPEEPKEARKKPRSKTPWTPVTNAPKKEGSEVDIAFGFRFTDCGNASRLVAMFGNDLRYAPALGWLSWDGARWLPDAEAHAIECAKKVAQLLWDAVPTCDPSLREALVKHARSSETAAKIHAAVELAKSDPAILVKDDAFDRDPWMLNAPNESIDLRTGASLPHDRKQLCTQVTAAPFDPEAKCPRFERFLEEVFENDRGVISFLQGWFGYVLHGEPVERAFVVCHGIGKNGKSTLLELFRDVLGDYATTINPGLLCEQGKKTSSGPSPEIARLRFVRFLIASETGAAQKLDEAKVKNMTGDESISGRHLYKGDVVFRPKFKLMLATNNKPLCDGGDTALFDRVMFLPFAVRFNPPDKKLGAALRQELPGILAWAVRGCLQWQRNGLGVPERIRIATSEYQHENDAFGRFLADRCTLGTGLFASKSALRAAYESWCQETGEHPFGGRRVTACLARVGVKDLKVRGERGWVGISVSGSSPRGQLDSSGGNSSKLSIREIIEKVTGNSARTVHSVQTASISQETAVVEPLLDNRKSPDDPENHPSRCEDDEYELHERLAMPSGAISTPGGIPALDASREVILAWVRGLDPARRKLWDQAHRDACADPDCGDGQATTFALREYRRRGGK